MVRLNHGHNVNDALPAMYVSIFSYIGGLLLVSQLGLEPGWWCEAWNSTPLIWLAPSPFVPLVIIANCSVWRPLLEGVPAPGATLASRSPDSLLRGVTRPTEDLDWPLVSDGFVDI